MKLRLDNGAMHGPQSSDLSMDNDKRIQQSPAPPFPRFSSTPTPSFHDLDVSDESTHDGEEGGRGYGEESRDGERGRARSYNRTNFPRVILSEFYALKHSRCSV